MVPVRSIRIEISTPAGIHCLQFRDHFPDPIDGIDDVGVALLGDLDQHRRLLVEPGNRPRIAHGILDFGDIREPDEIAVRTLDDDVAEFGRGPHLPIERQRLALPAAVENPDRAERIGIDDRVPDVVGRNARIRQARPD